MNNISQRPAQPQNQEQLAMAARLQKKKAIDYTGPGVIEHAQRTHEANLPWAVYAALQVDPDVSTLQEARRFDREAFTFSGRILNLGSAIIQTGLARQEIAFSLDEAIDVADYTYERYIKNPVRKFGRFAMSVLRQGGKVLEKGLDAFNNAGEQVTDTAASLLSVVTDGLINANKGRHRLSKAQPQAVCVAQELQGIDALDKMLGY